jgi:hypothetical protein
VIDESSDEVGDSHRYMIGAGVLVTRLEATRTQIAAEVFGPDGRVRPFHWVDEGADRRHAMLDLIGSLGIEVFAVVSTAETRHHLEHVRNRCLRELFRNTCELGLERIIIESRERAASVTGQNRRDYNTLIEARHAGELSSRVRYEWVLKADPIVWLADAVAGAVLGAERGDMSWLDRLGQRTRVQIVRIPPERA